MTKKRLSGLRVLELRGRIIDALRAWFKGQGFLEVTTPIFQDAPPYEPHIRSFAVTVERPFGESRRCWLRASPELEMKKLLAAGCGHIFQCAPVFRNREESPLHRSEFTLLEWYRRGGCLDDLKNDCRALLQAALDAVGASSFRHGRCAVSMSEGLRERSVAEVFSALCGIDVLATIGSSPEPAACALRLEAERVGVRCADDDTWEDVFHRLFLERIAPELGRCAPEFLSGYPLSLALLARRDVGAPLTARRMELFICGIELANGYEEEVAPSVNAERLLRLRRLRVAGGVDVVSEVPEPSCADGIFLEALGVRGLPPCCGMALGVERLLMLVLGEPSL